jgi:ribosomal protein L10
MRLTVMGQDAKGLDATQQKRKATLKSLESIKHYLWHGNVVRARDKIEDLHSILDHEGIAGENSQKLRKALDEFDTYIVVNQSLIPN